MDNIKISIARDFSTTPGGRFKDEGIYSGEEFREKILLPKYEKAKEDGIKIELDLDGCMGYPSSFLDESFGKLAGVFRNEDVFNMFIFRSKDQPTLVDDIKRYMENNRKNKI